LPGRELFLITGWLYKPQPSAEQQSLQELGEQVNQLVAACGNVRDELNSLEHMP
jgi:hypothetical protein